ncbi:MAG TPA: hypothetical protein VLF60_04395 [Candidatus Saccharimonadales bacterium]|nr:hypothetical protein [Candidatus Saccharimonadales bacterium]
MNGQEAQGPKPERKSFLTSRVGIGSLAVAAALAGSGVALGVEHLISGGNETNTTAPMATPEDISHQKTQLIPLDGEGFSASENQTAADLANSITTQHYAVTIKAPGRGEAKKIYKIELPPTQKKERPTIGFVMQATQADVPANQQPTADAELIMAPGYADLQTNKPTAIYFEPARGQGTLKLGVVTGFKGDVSPNAVSAHLVGKPLGVSEVPTTGVQLYQIPEADE